jgi:hypothetical protein
VGLLEEKIHWSKENYQVTVGGGQVVKVCLVNSTEVRQDLRFLGTCVKIRLIGGQWEKINLTGGQWDGGSYKCQIPRKIL